LSNRAAWSGVVLQARRVSSSVSLFAARKGRGLSSLVVRRARRQAMTGGFGFFAPRLDGFLTAEQMNRQPARLCIVEQQEERRSDRRVSRGGHRSPSPGGGTAATRAWCLGLEEEQVRLGAMLLAAGRTTGGT
jgi:hypothetical protein